jgi:hypothetical protein
VPRLHPEPERKRLIVLSAQPVPAAWRWRSSGNVAMVGSPHSTRRASLWPFKYELTHVNGAPFE